MKSFMITFYSTIIHIYYYLLLLTRKKQNIPNVKKWHNLHHVFMSSQPFMGFLNMTFDKLDETYRF